MLTPNKSRGSWSDTLGSAKLPGHICAHSWTNTNRSNDICMRWMMYSGEWCFRNALFQFSLSISDSLTLCSGPADVIQWHSIPWYSMPFHCHCISISRGTSSKRTHAVVNHLFTNIPHLTSDQMLYQFPALGNRLERNCNQDNNVCIEENQRKILSVNGEPFGPSINVWNAGNCRPNTTNQSLTLRMYPSII